MKSTHPLDVALDVAFDTRKEAIRLFAADGEICTGERRLLTAIDRWRAHVLDYRQRQMAADAYERNGPTRHTKQMFRDAGLRLVERKEACNVVAFSASDDGPDAA